MITHLIEVVLVGWRGLQAVSQSTLGIDADMSLHAEIPLIPFLGLMHLAVTLSTLIFGGVGGFDDGGIDQRALLHHNASVTKPLVDGFKELAGQLMLLKQITEVHDGSAVRNGLVKGVFGKQTHRGNLVESIFHGAVAEVVPLLHAVNADHGVEWVLTTPVNGLGINRFDDPQHHRPWEQRIHTGQE